MTQKTKFKQTEIGMIPEDWEILTIKAGIPPILENKKKEI